MAKGIDILGTLSGKRGGVVYYRRQGEQISRPKVTPTNPKSAKQALQRMVLASAAKLASAFEPIVNHSFEGVAVGTKSVQHFRSLAMNYLRSTAAGYFNGGQYDLVPTIFPIKGAPIVGGSEGLAISSGSLSLNAFELSNKVLSLALNSQLATTAFTTQAAYEAELAKLGLEPGDQLTFVLILNSLSDNAATMSYDSGSHTWSNKAQIVRFCRLVFVPTLPDSFSGTLITDSNINPALIQESYGALPYIPTSSTSAVGFNFASATPSDYKAAFGAIIRSQLQDNGKYKYSSARLALDEDVWNINEASPVYLSYMDGTTEINVGDALYLQHAVAAPFA